MPNSGLAAQEETGKTGNDQAVSDFLRRLEKKTSAFKSLQTSFVQEKELAAFKNKIVIEGRIYLLKPAKVAWHVDRPLKYSVIITDKSVKQWDEDTNQVQEIPFSENPVLRTVFGYLNGWFSGNYVSFLEDYDVRILQQEPPRLEFIPKAKSVVKKVVQSIVVSFQKDGRYLKQIKIQDISGDNTTISLENTLFNVPLDSSVWECRQ